MTREEFMLKVGVDTSAVARGLRGVKQQFASIGNEIRNGVAGWFGGAMIIGQLSRLGDEAERIRNNAEAWGVSSKFVQDIENVARATGVSAQKVQSLMDKFVRGLPAGSDAQQSFFALADRLSAIPDPAERARLAMEAFGKSGMDVVRIAGQGSQGLRELAASYQTLSDTELKQIDEAKQNIEDVYRSITVGAGKVIGFIANIGKAWGEYFGSKTQMKGSWDLLGSIVGKQSVVEADVEGVEMRRTQARLAAAKRMEDYQKALTAWKEKEAKLQKEKDAAALKAATELAKKQKDAVQDLRKSVSTFKDAQAGLAAAKSGRTEWTLSELASANPEDLGNAAWKVQAAQDVNWMREEAKFARVRGNDKYAEQLLSRSDQLARSIGGLAPGEVNPLLEQQKTLEESRDAVVALSEAATKLGIKIIPINGK